MWRPKAKSLARKPFGPVSLTGNLSAVTSGDLELGLSATELQFGAETLGTVSTLQPDRYERAGAIGRGTSARRFQNRGRARESSHQAARHRRRRQLAVSLI